MGHGRMDVDAPAPLRRRRREPAGPERVSVSHVASLAGVSIATVSRVLNASGPVAEPVRRRVEAAVLELGYTPNAAARALALNRTHTVGAVVPTLENSTFAIAVEALQARLRDAGYMLLLASSGYDIANESIQVRTLLSRGVEGIMVVGGRHDPETLKLCALRGVALVQTWALGAETACVGLDNHGIGRELAEHLLDLGHRQIGVIAGETGSNDRAAERVAGVREALSARGLSLAEECLIERPYRIVEGRIGLGALLAAEPRLTAVICGNDLLAFGALLEARARGLAVPGRLSVAGIDDMEFAADLDPPLTTVRVPADEIGRRSADYLIDILAGRAVAPVTTVPTSLIVRGSTGPAGREADP